MASARALHNLSQLPNLRVAARSAVFRYKGKETDPQKIGRDLQVSAVLTGRLLRQGDTLIVRAELVDVANGSQLWGVQSTRKPQDVFALQEDLAREISEKLKLRLTGEEKQRLTKRYTDNAEAYQLYLKGRYHWNKRNPDNYRKALEYFQQAIDKDPAYALAYAGMADTWAQISFFNVLPPREVMPKAKAAAEKALQIDDRLGEAYVSLGYISYTYDFDWTAAGKQFDQALALSPAYTRTHSFYPLYLSSLSRSQDYHRRRNQCARTRPCVAREQPQSRRAALPRRPIRSSHRAVPQDPRTRSDSRRGLPRYRTILFRQGDGPRRPLGRREIFRAGVATALCRSRSSVTPTPASASAARRSMRSSNSPPLQSKPTHRLFHSLGFTLALETKIAPSSGWKKPVKSASHVSPT